MSAPRWRWSVIGVWVALISITFIAIDSMAARSWLLLLVFGFVPPAMLLWLWNEDHPLLIGSLRGGERHREVVRQQFSFSPNGPTEKVEDYVLELEDVSSIQLPVVPSIDGRPAVARVDDLRVASI